MSVDDFVLGERMAMAVSAMIIAAGMLVGSATCDSCSLEDSYQQCMQSQRELYPRGQTIPYEHELKMRSNCGQYR